MAKKISRLLAPPRRVAAEQGGDLHRASRAGDRIMMFDDQDLGFFANFLGIFIFVLVMAYHFVMADVKYEGN
uniref:Dolichyl-diphosphooligosaccharide--protein glycosyltransferase subunit 4 n=1 Tax=Oryza nivara TaxID=4536 RepID=A0A0E0GNL7_ORYNI